ncbi:MAG: 4Fe-4S binding protein [Spirochaetota bacterium]|nr:4Fe-4S binding protein [Spirochaetota bacterium]
MNLRTIFGILPPKLIYSDDNLPIEECSLPQKSIILQSSEDPITLEVGDKLKSGKKLESCSIETGMFSPVTGTITEISTIKWTDGKEFTAITIETSGSDEWDSSLNEGEDLSNKSSEEAQAKLKELGFDLGISNDKRIDTIIINGLDSDLLVSKNQQILREKHENIKEGVELLKKITGAKRAVLAIPNNISGLSIGTEITAVNPVHPNGMSDMLPRLVLTDGEIDNSSVYSVELLNSIVESLKSGKPPVHKVITLIDKGGKALKNLRVRIGTPISVVLESNNIAIQDNDKLILGGPMLGEVTYLADFPVTHKTEAIYIQDSEEVAPIANITCINCGKCVDACPYNLQINLLGRYSEFSLFERCEELDIDYCIECGLCAYVCPAGRPLVQYIQFAKHEIKELKNKEEEESTQ